MRNKDAKSKLKQKFLFLVKSCFLFGALVPKRKMKDNVNFKDAASWLVRVFFLVKKVKQVFCKIIKLCVLSVISTSSSYLFFRNFTVKNERTKGIEIKTSLIKKIKFNHFFLFAAVISLSTTTSLAALLNSHPPKINI